MIVRPLAAADAPAFRDIRLKALKEHPTAYGSTYAEWADLSLDAFTCRIESGVLFGLFAQETLQGTLAYDREAGGNARHRAGIHAVYLRPEIRGQGGIDRLLRAAIAQARQEGVIQLELAVAHTSLGAIRAYRRNGFVQFATTPRAILSDGVFHDELHMILRLEG